MLLGKIKYKIMYIQTHGVTGAAITTVAVMINPIIGFPIGIALAFTSHFLLDYINEYSFGSMKKILNQQAIPIITFGLLTIYLAFNGHLLYAISFLVGYLAGNGPDIRDKAIKYIKKALPVEKQLSCHNGESRIFRYKNFKLGYPTIYNVTKVEQNQITFFVTVFIIIFTFLII